MEFPDLQLNEKALAKRQKMMDKVSRAEQNLASLLAYHESNPSYVEKRDFDSVNSFQYRLDALNREEEEAVAKFREQFRTRRDNIQHRLEEAKRRMDSHKTSKPKAIHTAETSLKILLEEMDSYNLLTTKERQRLWELRGAANTPSNTISEAPAPVPIPPKEPELPADVKEYLAERGTMPANREDLELFKERREILKEMSREKREREQREEEKKEEANKQYQLQKEMELQREKERQEEKRKSDIKEAELVAKAIEAAKIPIPEVDVEEFEGRKVSKFEKEQILKSRKKDEEKKVKFQEPSSDTEDEEDDSSDSELDEEEYKKLVAAQKAELRRKHEERMKKQQSFYTPPVPEVQEFPKIVSNTKAKKPIKMLKK